MPDFQPQQLPPAPSVPMRLLFGIIGTLLAPVFLVLFFGKHWVILIFLAVAYSAAYHVSMRRSLRAAGVRGNAGSRPSNNRWRGP
jgi:uncharacterized membrane protein